MKHIYISLLLIFFSITSTSAQTQNVCSYGIVNSNILSESDSVKLEDLQYMSLSYFNSRRTLDRNYNFEIYNKKRKLKMWSNEVRLLGYASFLGICFGGPLLFPDASLWVLIPTEVVIGGGIIVGSNIWANNLRKKADALKDTSFSVLKINSNSNLVITQYTADLCPYAGIGLGYRYKF